MRKRAPSTSSAEGGSRPSAQGFGFTLTVLGVLLAVTLGSQLPAAICPSWLSGYRGTFRTLWPQGWSFFSNTADMDTVTAFRVDSTGAVITSAVAVSMSEKNQWGLGRTSQTEYEEVSYLAGQVPDRNWVSCDDPLSRSCLSRTRTYRMMNPFQPALLCGRFVLIRSKPWSPPVAHHALDQHGAVTVVQLECSG